VRIDRIGIDGFGTWHDTRIEPDPGLTLLQGPNEAGKTTVLAFIRAILFGFETGRYPALAGGRRGGWLEVTTDDGRHFRIERYGERGGAGSLRVLGPDGEDRGPGQLERLLHGVEASVYRNVFAFRLDELTEFRGLTQGDIAARIYGAGLGTGAASALAIEGELRTAAADRFKPGGQNPAINRLLREIEQLDEALARLDPPREYAELRAELARRESEREALGDAIDTLAAERRALERVIGAWEPYLALRHAEEELAGLADPGSVPADALERHSALEEAARSSEEAVAAARRRRDRLDDELAALIVDEGLIARADEVRRVVRLGEAEEARSGPDRAAAAEAARVAHEHALMLSRLGGWDAARLERVDTSVAARAEATGRFRDLLDAASRDGDRADAELRAAERAATVAGDELDAAAGTGPRAPEPAAPPQAARGATWLPAVPAAAALGAGWLVAAALAVVGVPLPAVVLVAVASVVAAGGAWSLRRPAGVASVPATGVGDADPLRAPRERYAAARREMERARLAAERAVTASAAARAEWEGWLAAHGLDPGLDRETAVAVLDAASRATELQDRLRELERGLAERAAERTASAEAAATLLRELGRQVPAPEALPERIARLGTDLASSVAAREARQRLTAERESAELDAATASERLERALADRGALLEECGATDPADLRERVGLAAARRRLAGEADAARRALVALSGPGDALVRLLEETAAVGEIAERRDRLASVRASIEERTSERDACVQAIGALRHQVDELAASEAASDIRQRRADLVSRLEAEADRWSVHSLAVALLRRTRERFEREHRPGVLRTAEAFLSDWTGGRYRRITAPLGGSIEGLERADGTRVPVDGLSRGTQEQLYLALRFGLIEHFADEAEPLPIVMDEILVNFDETRAARAARTIEQLARRHQIIYFTYRTETPLQAGKRVLLSAPGVPVAD
jgi:uncharacterized protein YhaN